MSPQPRVTLLTRPGCHLCEQARSVVAQVAAETGTGWTERSIAEDPAVKQRYAELIPVVLLDGEEIARWRVDPDRLRAALTGRRRASSWWPRWRRRTP